MCSGLTGTLALAWRRMLTGCRLRSGAWKQTWQLRQPALVRQVLVHRGHAAVPACQQLLWISRQTPAPTIVYGVYAQACVASC